MIVKSPVRSFSNLIAYGITAVLILMLFWDRLVWMFDLWRSDGLYSLSAVVPVVSTAVVWSKRKQLAALPVQPSRWGVVLVMFTAGITLAADWLNILHSFTPLLLVAMLGGIVLGFWGTAVLKELLFPLTFLLLLVPIPPPVLERIDLPLQIICAKAVAALAHLARMPAERTGSMLVFPDSSRINVAPACNGVRSAITMSMLSIVYVYLSRDRWYSKVAVVAAAVPIAYFSNLVRLLGVVSGADLLGWRFMEYEQTFDLMFGALVFIGCVLLLLLWARVVRCRALMEIS